MVVARPVLVSVASAFLLLLGFVAIPNLPVREYPSIDPATVTVSASWRGADAETVEKQRPSLWSNRSTASTESVR
ncbi:MAG: efflux RND transporter permease subunit [Fibrobacteres bacterium]|nr:efflux RND transporter permease subunit [Fibrobacterota bacterium]